MREPPRKCSFCGHHGHNSRTCNAKASGTNNNNNNNNINNNNNNGSKSHCVKLFGVTISDDKAVDPMKKSKSMGNLGSRDHPNDDDSLSSDESGYLSDGLIHDKRQKAAHERKKGTPWSEEEHRTFLVGLSELGKGDWRGISMKYVQTRTPTQVASHAQKYFLRKSAPNDRRKRRSSLFDMPYSPDDTAQSSSPPHKKSEAENSPLASSRQLILPGNSSTEVTNRFPHLCLDSYPVPIRPSPSVAYRPTPNYQPLPYQCPMGLGIPTNVYPWAVNMMRYGYVYNPNNIPLSGNMGLGVVVTHPSGIPPPRGSNSPQPPNDNNIIGTEPERGDGLDLRIALPPHSKPTSAPSSPASSGAIKVT